MAGSTISTTLTKEIVLGSVGTGIFLSPLTVTTTGRINAPADTLSFQRASAIYANASGGSLVNLGTITGGIPAVDVYTVPAILAVQPLDVTNDGSIGGQSGIYLEAGGTVSNQGNIAGTDARNLGGYGVRLTGGTLENTGSVYGKRYGAAELGAAEVLNSGTITGETAGIRLISFTGNGTVVNSGLIAGGSSGITEASALITNSGTIEGQSFGIFNLWGGSIYNTGYLSGASDGVLILNEQYQASDSTTMTNAGTVLGGYFGVAVNFGTMTNTSFGLISGTEFGAGVEMSGSILNEGTIKANFGGLVVESGGTATNAGIVAGAHIGIDLFYQGTATNASTGYVTSVGTGALAQAAYLQNAGTIIGNTYGIELLSGGIAVNYGTVSSPTDEGIYLSTLSATTSPDFLVNKGEIYGGLIGAFLRNGTAFNYGSIYSPRTAVTMVSGTSFNNLGNVSGQYGVELQGGTLKNSGSIRGTVDGILANHGGYITTSGTVYGAKYALLGSSFSLIVDPGAVFVGKVTDKSKTSKLILAGDTPGTLTGLGTQIVAFASITFEPGAQWVLNGNTAVLAGGQPISGFEQGDTIIVNNFTASSGSFVSGRGYELIAGSTTKFLDIIGSFTTPNFKMSSGIGGTTIALTSTAPCFASRTRILTPEGEIPVEALKVGDLVITEAGPDQPIIWIGQRTLDLKAHSNPAQAQPVCISAGALGQDVPRRDLWVSPDHALLIEGELVPAQLLINGLNIRQLGLERITYYHLELPDHAIIFAEHAAAESYLETGNRSAFTNGGGTEILSPDFGLMLRRQNSCAPLLLEGARLEQIRRRVLNRYAHRP